MKKYVLSIDPSINNVGWALSKNKKLIKWGIIHPAKDKKKTYLDKCKDIISQIIEIYSDLPDVQLVTEIPDHFGTSGYIARESGAILKLAFIAGMIYNIDSDVVSYTPNQWKGQLPKHVMTMRLCKNEPYKSMKIVDWKDIYYCKECKVKHPKILFDHNIIDGIGINHFHVWGKL
jgi:hypothetical protein